jgi:hypothetical protein
VADGRASARLWRAPQGEREWRRRSTSRRANRALRTLALRRSSGWPPTCATALGRRAELRVDDALPQAGKGLRAAAEDSRRASFRGVRVHHAGAVLCHECRTRSRLWLTDTLGFNPPGIPAGHDPVLSDLSRCIAADTASFPLLAIRAPVRIPRGFNLGLQRSVRQSLGGNHAAQDRPAAWGTSSVAALGTSMAGAPTQLMSARCAAARSGAEMAPNAERNRREKQSGSPEEDRVSQQREWSHEVALRA